MVFFHASPVCWRSARQAFVTLSTAEAELVAGLDTVVAVQSAEAMLSEFGAFGFDKTLRVDSQSALAIAIGQEMANPPPTAACQLPSRAVRDQ